MKFFSFILIFAFLLAACQSQPATATPAPVAANPAAATSAPAKNADTPAAAPIATSTPAGPAVHSSNPDSNAPNLLVIKDQLIVNNSLTFDTVVSSEPANIVIYYDKSHQGTHELGGIITYLAVPAGKSNNFVMSLTQNLNPSVTLAGLGNRLVHAVLQKDPSNPNSIIKVDGKEVSVMFTILAKPGDTGIFGNPTP